MKRRITLSIALVLSIVFVSLMISDTGIVTPGAAIAESPVTPAPPTPCDMIKGKTYISFITGNFDPNNINSASASKITFDDQGNGTARGLLVYDPTTEKLGQSQMSTVTCSMFQEKNGVFIGMLTFSSPDRPNTGNRGSSRVWVYDNGAKFWGEETIHTLMAGWNLQVPKNPSIVR